MAFTLFTAALQLQLPYAIDCNYTGVVCVDSCAIEPAYTRLLFALVLVITVVSKINYIIIFFLLLALACEIHSHYHSPSRLFLFLLCLISALVL